MQTFKYPLLAKLIYRYANIPATLLLFVHLIFSAMAIPRDALFIVPLFINAGIIYLLNIYYVKMYKTFPYHIEVDSKKMICTGFMLSSKKFEINLSDVDSITGGIFSGSPMKPIYIHDGIQDIQIGVNQHLKDFNKFLTIVLSNIKQELYEDILKKMETRKAEVQEKFSKRKKK